MTVEVWLEDGAGRAITRDGGPTFRVQAWLGAYDEALTEWEARYAQPRANLRFLGLDQAGLHFAASPKLALPSGHRWMVKEASSERGEPKALLQALAAALGFPLFGVTTPELPARYRDRFSRWLEAGAHGGMDFIARKRRERLEPERVQANAQSVLVLATPYAPEAPAGSARVARYASVRDYHAVIPPRLAIIKRVLRQLGSERNYVSCDTGPVLERAYAERAGIGWIGKNGMLISRTHGSMLLLATVWTTLRLALDAPHEEYCGSCDACRAACPTAAIPEPGWVDARRCISYWTIEHPGEEWPPEAPPLAGWAFGCDACQDACPWNRFASEPAIRALAERRLLPADVRGWERLTGDALAQLIDGTPMTRAGAAGLLRNVRALKVLK